MGCGEAGHEATVLPQQCIQLGVRQGAEPGGELLMSVFMMTVVRQVVMCVPPVVFSMMRKALLLRKIGLFARPPSSHA
jgi:hypothetical protein